MLATMEWGWWAAVWLLFPLGVLFGGVYDFLTLEIPNALIAALAVLFVPLALVTFSWEQIGVHFIAGLSVLAMGFFAFARGWVGGGDAKLCAICALWLGWPLTFDFLFWMGLLGGGFALLLVMTRGVFSSLPLFQIVMPFWARQEKLQNFPYGTPMALAAVYVFYNHLWLAQEGLLS